MKSSRKSSRKPVDKHGREMPVDPERDRAMNRFIENVVETEFSEALAAANDPKYTTFLRARADPAYRSLGFSALTRKFNISLQEVDDLWRNHQLHRGMIRMMNRMPDILEDVAEDARSKMVACPRCDGVTTVAAGVRGETRPCPVCDGTGKVRAVGDRAARQLVFETAGLIGKPGPTGPLVNVNLGLESGLADLLVGAQKIVQSPTVALAVPEPPEPEK